MTLGYDLLSLGSTAGAGTGFLTLLGTGGCLGLIPLTVSMSLDRNLSGSSQDFITDGTLHTSGRAGSSAGCFHSGNLNLGMAQLLQHDLVGLGVILTVEGNGCGVGDLTLCGAGGIHLISLSGLHLGGQHLGFFGTALCGTGHGGSCHHLTVFLCPGEHRLAINMGMGNLFDGVAVVGLAVDQQLHTGGGVAELVVVGKGDILAEQVVLASGTVILTAHQAGSSIAILADLTGSGIVDNEVVRTAGGNSYQILDLLNGTGIGDGGLGRQQMDVCTIDLFDLCSFCDHLNGIQGSIDPNIALNGANGSGFGIYTNTFLTLADIDQAIATDGFISCTAGSIDAITSNDVQRTLGCHIGSLGRGSNNDAITILSGIGFLQSDGRALAADGDDLRTAGGINTTEVIFAVVGSTSDIDLAILITQSGDLGLGAGQIDTIGVGLSAGLYDSDIHGASFITEGGDFGAGQIDTVGCLRRLSHTQIHGTACTAKGGDLGTGTSEVDAVGRAGSIGFTHHIDGTAGFTQGGDLTAASHIDDIAGGGRFSHIHIDGTARTAKDIDGTLDRQSSGSSNQVDVTALTAHDIQGIAIVNVQGVIAGAAGSSGSFKRQILFAANTQLVDVSAGFLTHHQAVVTAADGQLAVLATDVGDDTALFCILNAIFISNRSSHIDTVADTGDFTHSILAADVGNFRTGSHVDTVVALGRQGNVTVFTAERGDLRVGSHVEGSVEQIVTACGGLAQCDCSACTNGAHRAAFIHNNTIGISSDLDGTTIADNRQGDSISFLTSTNHNTHIRGNIDGCTVADAADGTVFQIDTTTTYGRSSFRNGNLASGTTKLSDATALEHSNSIVDTPRGTSTREGNFAFSITQQIDSAFQVNAAFVSIITLSTLKLNGTTCTTQSANLTIYNQIISVLSGRSICTLEDNLTSFGTNGGDLSTSLHICSIIRSLNCDIAVLAATDGVNLTASSRQVQTIVAAITLQHNCIVTGANGSNGTAGCHIKAVTSTALDGNISLGTANFTNICATACHVNTIIASSSHANRSFFVTGHITRNTNDINRSATLHIKSGIILFRCTTCIFLQCNGSILTADQVNMATGIHVDCIILCRNRNLRTVTADNTDLGLGVQAVGATGIDGGVTGNGGDLGLTVVVNTVALRIGQGHVFHVQLCAVVVIQHIGVGVDRVGDGNIDIAQIHHGSSAGVIDRNNIRGTGAVAIGIGGDQAGAVTGDVHGTAIVHGINNALAIHLCTGTIKVNRDGTAGGIHICSSAGVAIHRSHQRSGGIAIAVLIDILLGNAPGQGTALQVQVQHTTRTRGQRRLFRGIHLVNGGGGSSAIVVRGGHFLRTQILAEVLNDTTIQVQA